MRYLLVSLIFIAVTYQSVADHGCKTGCDCPDFSTLIEDAKNQTYTKIDSCSFESSCLNGAQAALQFLWEGTEIERPTDAVYDIFGSVLEGSAPFPSVDFFTTFGITCEDGAWIATKYNLTQYLDTTFNNIIIPQEKTNGKKSRILLAGW